MTTDRRLRYGEAPTGLMLFIWLLACAGYLALRWGYIVDGRFLDPDDAMRMVQVRDLLNGQGWFDLQQYRLGSPAGVEMHWSRIIDVPIAALVLCFTPFLGSANAELAAATLVPLLYLGATMAVSARLAWRLLGREAAIFACLVLPLLPMVVAQFTPMRVDHHAAQIALCMAGLAALAARRAICGAAVAGVIMATGTLISTEMLPNAAILGMVLLARWLRNIRDRQQLVAYLQALSLTQIALFLTTRGMFSAANSCDAVATAHLAFFAIAALGTGLIARVPRLTSAALLTGLAMVGGVALAAFTFAAPQCLAPPFADLDPLVRQYWYENILEGQPLWRHDATFILLVLPQTVLSLIASLILASRQSDWLQRWWFEYSFVLAATIVLGMLVTRSLAFAAVIGAVPLGWLLAQLFHAYTHSGNPWRKLANALLLTSVMVPAVGIALAKPVVAASRDAPARERAAEDTVAATQCLSREALAQLATLPPGTMLTMFDLGPSILQATPHRVIATSHHRANQPMHDTIAAFLGSQDDAREVAAGYAVDYVLICPNLIETQLYADNSAPNSLLRLQAAGKMPAWLHRSALELPEGLDLFEVSRASVPR